jgi:hypothetical protein
MGKIDTGLILFPWRRYDGCMQQIPVLHIWRFHVAVYKLYRGKEQKWWLPNLAIVYLNLAKLKPPSLPPDHNL